jgi:hypothetical protein
VASNDRLVPEANRARDLAARIFNSWAPPVIESESREGPPGSGVHIVGSDEPDDDGYGYGIPGAYIVQRRKPPATIDWDDPDLVLPPWAVGLTETERRLVEMVGNSERERYAEQLRSYREPNVTVDNAVDENSVALAPPALRQDLPGATPRPYNRGEQEWAGRSHEPKPEGPVVIVKPAFVALTDSEAARVQPAKHAIRHKDRSRGYFARAVAFSKRNGRPRRL